MSATWPMVSLGEVLKERREKPDAESLALGNIRIVSKIRFDTGKIELRQEIGTKTGMILVRPGDLLLSGINAAKGAIAIYGRENTEPVAATIHYGACEVVENRVDISYLWWYLRSRPFREILFETLPGGIKTEIKASRLLPIRVPLPTLSEQRRIVARIEELAAKIKDARGLRLQTAEEADALVQATARRVLEGVEAKVTELGSWLNPTREGIQTGPFGVQLGSADFVDSGIPVLTIGNVQYGGLRLDDLKHVSNEKAGQLDRYSIKTGDILFARMGTVGRCCITPPEAEGWLINYHIIRVALDQLRAEPRFIHWTIRGSADVEEYLDEKIRGATRQGVNSAIVSGLPCRVPLPAEQRRIVAYLDDLQAKVDGLKRSQTETSAELDALLPSILDKAFRRAL